MLGLLVSNRDVSAARHASGPLQPILPEAIRRLIAAFFRKL